MGEPSLHEHDIVEYCGEIRVSPFCRVCGELEGTDDYKPQCPKEWTRQWKWHK